MAYTDIDKPSDYFETLLSTGDGGSQTFTGLDFQPDWVWSKRRQTHVHQLYDSVRTAGSGKALQSDSTAAEGGDGGTYGYLSSFTSDGFASTAGSSNNNYFNADGGTYVFWNWKAGTAVSGNTTGSGTAKAYTGSVNTDAGFSIIRYLGNAAAGHTVPHHLGVAPKAMIVKSLAASQSWFINFPFGTGAGYIMLDRTNAGDGSNDSVWSSTAPSSSVVTLGETGGVNENNDAYIMYAFAEKQGYSKFGSYKGNGNANGTFVYTGFKPAWIMFKQTNTTSNWTIYDTTRDTFNVMEDKIHPNTSGAESDFTGLDSLSNGFKFRTTEGTFNASGGSFIYMAFAKNPFVTSTGVPATAR